MDLELAGQRKPVRVQVKETMCVYTYTGVHRHPKTRFRERVRGGVDELGFRHLG